MNKTRKQQQHIKHIRIDIKKLIKQILLGRFGIKSIDKF
jgi:hypothetical protein